MPVRTSLLGLFACTLMACGARSLGDGDLPVGGPRPASGGDASTVRRPVCGDTVDPAIEAQSCGNIGEITIASIQVVDAGPPRGASPGQTALIEVRLSNTGKQAFQNPCVGLATDNPMVSVLPPNPYWGLFAVLPGTSETTTLVLSFDAAIQVGATVLVTAWVDALHAGCTNGATSTTAITVQP